MDQQRQQVLAYLLKLVGEHVYQCQECQRCLDNDGHVLVCRHINADPTYQLYRKYVEYFGLFELVHTVRIFASARAIVLGLVRPSLPVETEGEEAAAYEREF